MSRSAFKTDPTNRRPDARRVCFCIPPLFFVLLMFLETTDYGMSKHECPNVVLEMVTTLPVVYI